MDVSLANRALVALELEDFSAWRPRMLWFGAKGKPNRGDPF